MPLLNNDTRTATLRATVKNNDKVLKPGMFVSGKSPQHRQQQRL